MSKVELVNGLIVERILIDRQTEAQGDVIDREYLAERAVVIQVEQADLIELIQFAEAMAQGGHGPGGSVEQWSEGSGTDYVAIGRVIRKLGRKAGIDAGWADRG